jgi:hypothetical protein
MIRSRLRWEIGSALAAKTMLLLALYMLFFSSGAPVGNAAPAVWQHVFSSGGR